jgi:hypothetical protein
MEEYIRDPMAVLVMLVVIGLILSEIEQHFVLKSPFRSGKSRK